MPKVAVTEAAAEQLHNLLVEHQMDDAATLRLVPQPGGRLGISLDRPGDSDQRVELGGETILVVSPGVADMLDGSVIDVLETADGPRLTIRV
jgi:Fe-S cluster assembly iron-binding protein IscA